MSIAVTQLNTVKFKWTQWQITRHFTHFFSVRFFAGILDFTDLYVCVLTCFWKWLDCRTYTKQIDFNSGLWFELWLYFFSARVKKTLMVIGRQKKAFGTGWSWIVSKYSFENSHRKHMQRVFCVNVSLLTYRFRLQMPPWQICSQWVASVGVGLKTYVR